MNSLGVVIPLLITLGVYFVVSSKNHMITLLLVKTILWYIGALFILWYVTLAWLNGVAFLRIAPGIAIVVLMLVNASFVYYDYVGTPADTLVQYVWVLAIAWLFISVIQAFYMRNKS